MDDVLVASNTVLPVTKEPLVDALGQAGPEPASGIRVQLSFTMEAV